MKNVQIILDSACDMQKPEADALGVTLLPLRTNFGGEVFLDGVTMTHDEFFEKLTQAKTLPTTSQIPPFDFEEAFRRLHAEGSDILVITLSSKLSGTYQSAVIAAQETGIDVTIVDSENVTAGERVLADLAIRLRDKGFGAKEIAAKLEEAKKRLCIIGRVDTLEYLYRGGRLLENERDCWNTSQYQASPDRQRWAARRPWKGQRRKTEQQFPERSDCKARRH